MNESLYKVFIMKLYITRLYKYFEKSLLLEFYFHNLTSMKVLFIFIAMCSLIDFAKAGKFHGKFALNLKNKKNKSNIQISTKACQLLKSDDFAFLFLEKQNKMISETNRRQ